MTLYIFNCFVLFFIFYVVLIAMGTRGVVHCVDDAPSPPPQPYPVDYSEEMKKPSAPTKDC